MKKNQGNGHADEPVIYCARCGLPRIVTSEVDDEFRYGEGPAAVVLQVRVPLRTCEDCGFQFLDEHAENLRNTAIAEHQAAAHARGV